jgi:hypothetical protein
MPNGLIQGSRDFRFELSQKDALREWLEQFREYRDLTVKARQTWPELRLILWPESAFPQVDMIPQADEHTLSVDRRATVEDGRDATHQSFRIGMGEMPMRGDRFPVAPFTNAVPLLTGAHGLDPVRNNEFNSAILFDDDGAIVFR